MDNEHSDRQVADYIQLALTAQSYMQASVDNVTDKGFAEKAVKFLSEYIDNVPGEIRDFIPASERPLLTQPNLERKIQRFRIKLASLE
ncbi:hypothetical protein HOA55_01030 [archaeon]|jgi:hypothetical protein|nr:hypothetical protein [archaeon]MBT3577543.1 hypothetical protein [archaeon]MBT6819918.1 hypothetical protein [archaeon]MBT6956672.1 hypothetical protein [archaeon]MBT7025074.1 hypothetical protein [archaeon]